MADPDLMLALYEPDIAPNAGAMLRTCACLGVAAAIIEPAGFVFSDRRFRRSGMDYLEFAPHRPPRLVSSSSRPGEPVRGGGWCC